MNVAFIFYELLRFVAIITSRTEYSVQSLPLSWYVAVPLAFLPTILIFMIFNDKSARTEGESRNTLIFLYIITKILMVPGYIAYLIKGIGHYSIGYLLAIVLFLLIDVILIIIFSIIIMKNQNHKETNKEDSADQYIE